MPIAKLTVPAGVTSIGARAFENCQNLTEVNFEGTASSPDLFIGTSYLRSYTKDGIEMFSLERGNVFASCTKLMTVNLSANVTTLGDYTFSSTGDVGFAVNLPDDSRLATIGAFCFYGSRLVSFKVPATVRNLPPVTEHGTEYDRLGIGAYAFAVSTGKLVEIIFSEDDNSYPLTIGYGAFENQSRLEAIELPARLSPYTGHTGETISPLADGPLVFYGASSLTEITVSGDGGAYTVVSGVLYTADMTELVFCPMLYSGEVDVPTSVTKIHGYAFMGCTDVTAVNFDDACELRIIGDYAFYSCESITDLILPDSVISVGSGAFNNAISLESITLSAGLSVFDVSILNGCTSLACVYVSESSEHFISEDGILYNCDQTELIVYPAGRTDSEYEVPDGVITIGNHAFSDNLYIETVILPDGLVEIGAGAFANCLILQNTVIPKTVSLIDEGAFKNTGSLFNLTFLRFPPEPTLSEQMHS